jgi:deoxyhypusine synthase
MRKWRLKDVPFVEGVDDPALRPASVRERIRARIFLAYTSNQISCGQREVIRFLVQNKMVDVVITTAGGIEEDLIKCLQPTFLGDFALSGRELRRKGINRIGNLLVPNTNYCEFEDWVSPVIHRMHDELDEATQKWAQRVSAGENSDDSSNCDRFLWTPSKVIERLGKEIDHPDSVLYWAGMCSIRHCMKCERSLSRVSPFGNQPSMAFRSSARLLPMVALVICYTSTPTSARALFSTYAKT